MSIWEVLLAIVLGSVTLALLALTLHKVRLAHMMLLALPTRDELNHHYRQIEALGSLYRDVGFIRSLPPLRGYAASPDFLRMIAGHIASRRPRRVLELGSGASSIVVGQALKNLGRGHLWSLEHNAACAETTRAMLRDHELDDWVTVIHAKLTPYTFAGQQYLWYHLQQVPEIPFDTLIVDGPPLATQQHARYPALPLLLNRLSRNAVIFADDTARSDDAAVMARWAKEFPDFHFESRLCEKGCMEIVRNAELPQIDDRGEPPAHHLDVDPMAGKRLPSAG